MQSVRDLIVTAAINKKIQILPELFFGTVDKLHEKKRLANYYDGIAIVRDIAYGQESPLQKGDLYFKPDLLKSEEKFPLIFNIHGGSFLKGDKALRNGISEAWANAGYYVYSINYRTAPEVDMWGLLKDCAAAWNYLPTLAEDYNIDLSKVVITGDSSGTFCAAFLTSIAFDDSLCKEAEFPELKLKPAAAMFHGGFYDMDRFLQLKMPFNFVPDMVSLICKCMINKDLSNLNDYPHFATLSPIKYVNSNWCPTFLSWSETDFIVPGQGRPMTDKLRENSVPVGTYSINDKKYGHCFHLDIDTEPAKECLRESLMFLDTNL